MSNLTVIIIIFVGIGLWYVLVSKRKNKERCEAPASEAGVVILTKLLFLCIL
jgi:hypothetical protein